jgi:flagellar protein FliS
MNNAAAQSYLRAKVLTATPEQLQLMLYDGAIRFTEQGRLAIEKKNFEESYKTITKAMNIIVELNSTLKHDRSPDLCGKLAALYNYVYRKLVSASTARKTEPLEDALRILRHQRETWAMLMDKLGKQKAASAARGLDMPEPNARMEASISMQG